MKMVLDFSDFIAGWIGGIFGLLVGHPLDTVKVRQQAYGSSFATALGRTYRHEGIPGFFKGIMFPLITVGPTSALLFGIYGNVLHHLEPTRHEQQLEYHEAEVIRHIYIAGTIGGLFQAVATCPVELIKTVLQARTGGTGSWRKHYEVPYNGSIDAFRGIVRDRGFFGLFRGLTPLLLRDVPTSGLYILTYEWLNNHLSQFDLPVVAQRSLAGGTAGIMSWLFVIPLDVVKSRIQTDNPKDPKYKGVVDCFVKSYKAEGLRIFFKGAPVTLIRTFPTNAATFVGYEMTLEYFHEMRKLKK